MKNNNRRDFLKKLSALGAGLGEEGAQHIQGAGHGAAGDQHLGDEEVAALEARANVGVFSILFEKLLQRVDRQKSLILKLVERGEKICKFFDQRVSYEEILDEIEDKEYSDARHLLTEGYRPERVAKDAFSQAEAFLQERQRRLT